MALLRIAEVAPLPGHRLRLRLTDGATIERDVGPLLAGPVFDPIREEPQMFARVRIDGGTVSWPNGADLCPDVLIWGGIPPSDPAVRPEYRLAAEDAERASVDGARTRRSARSRHSATTIAKEAFLADPHVEAMQPWVTARLDKASGWTHTYVDRRTGVRWSCNGLADAFRQYRWNRKPWPENKTELDGYRRDLRRAVGEEDIRGATDACERILRWGGVWAHNGSYLRRRRSVLLDELRHLRAVIDGDHTPAKSEMRRDPSTAGTECRMNAGFVKIYSLLCDHCVMYDGRVGAALGLLVRQFCEDTGRTTVPPCLAFAFGSPKEAPNARCPKLRDPGRNELRFPRLRPNPRFHTAQVMRANWFLRGVLATGAWPCSPGEDGFHELAAGLFMVGYDLRDAT